jgi:MSHA biogenesis protein MshQ
MTNGTSKYTIKNMTKSTIALALMISSSANAIDLLDGATITAIDAELNSSSWAAGNLIDNNSSTRWLSNKQSNDINFVFGAISGAACFDSLDLVNYGTDDRAVSRFALFRTMDNTLQADIGTSGWIPIIADSSPSGLIDHLNWVQGGRLTAIDSQLNTTSWAAEHSNDGDSASRWLSNKSNNVLEYAFDTDWDGNTGDAINIKQITVSNYGADDRSVSTFQIEVTTDGSTWSKLEVPGSVAGEVDFNFTLQWNNASITAIDSQLNTTSWAAENIHDGDNNSRWLSNKSNNSLAFEFDVDGDGTSGADGDSADVFVIEKVFLRNYGSDDRSIREFQVEYKTSSNSHWQKIPVPGSSAGEQDFNFLLSQHGAVLSAINGQLNSSTWGADNIHDGDTNSRWLNNTGNNTLDFVFDIDGDGTTGSGGDSDDLFTIEKIFLQNYGTDDRSVRQFQVEVRTQSNTQSNTDWTKLQVPGTSANQPGYNFVLSAQGGTLDLIDSQLNATRWGADNIHDGDLNSRWLSNKPTNTLAFSFDTDLDGSTGDSINLDTVELINYGSDDRSIQTFEIDIQVSGGGWQTINAPGGGTTFTANMDSNGQSWPVGSFANVTAARIRTLSNHGDRNYTGAREIVFSGASVGPSYTFVAAMNGNGETFTLDSANRPVDVTEVRFRSLNNHGDPNYTGAREFAVLGTSVTRNSTFTAAMHGNGETYILDMADRPADVTEVRLLTINNHGDPNYTGAREFAVLGPSIGAAHTFSLPMTTGPHSITLDSEDGVSSVIGARFITITNHGDPNYTGLRELQLQGDPVGPSYLFDAQMDGSTQTYNFQSALGTVFRFHSLGNHGDPNYTGVAELALNSSNSCVYGQWRLDESAWAGAANDVLDYSGNNLHGAAYNGASADGTDPAISGDPGTCRYGQFDGQDDHVEVSAAFPNIQDSFTITAWIYAEDLSSGSRIFADDENNTAGYAFSLGDGGNGRLRFYSRGVTPISVDTQSVVITPNTWHFVAAVHNSVTKTRQIFVDGVAQTLTGGSTVHTYTGTWGTDGGRTSIGGETNNAGENRANFRFQGRIDEATVYSGALTQSDIATLQSQTHSCSSGSSLNRFAVNVGSVNASTCVPKTLTITACANADCSTTLTDYTGSVDISTSSNHGDWSTTGAGLISPSPDNDDNGQVSYQFDESDDGVISVSLSNSHADNLTVTVEDSGAGVSSDSEAIAFADNVFVISNDALQIAGRGQNMSAALWTNDGSNCAIAAQYSGAKNLKAWISRDTADPNGAAPIIGSLSLPDSLPSSNNLSSLNFVNGEASFTLSTSDVGQYEVNLRDDTSLFADAVIDGSSEITTRPFGFYLNVLGNPSPAAADAFGPVYIGAGNNFSVSATAVQWQAADDTDADGVPDGHTDTDPSNNADLSDNAVTVSFGVEQNAQAESVVLTGLGFLPGGGVFDDSANIGNAPTVVSFVNGVGSTATARYSEVGIIEVSASLADAQYLQSGNVVGVSGYVGRFTPDHFVLQAPVLMPAGGNYTYLGQTFTGSFELTAVNAGGDTTRNYAGSFLKLSESHLNANADYGAVDLSAGVFMASRTSASNHSITDSAGVITIANVDLIIAKSNIAEAPFSNIQIGLDMADTDAVELTVKDLDTTGDANSDKVTVGSLAGELRFARVFIAPVYGPETPAFDAGNYPDALVKMPFEIQYFNGTQFVVNADDSSSTYNQWTWTLTDNCTDGSLNCGGLPGNFAVALPIGTAMVSEGRPDISLPLTITRPGMSGNVRLGVDVDDWLQFDWDANGSDDNPDALVTWGTYRGHDRIIYWREKQN